MSTYSQRINDTVNNGRAWKTPCCICSCQLFIKSEVCYGDCWKLRRLLEAATDCQQGPQYDGKCSFYFNCYFFPYTPTNRDLRQKAVYFPAWGPHRPTATLSSPDLLYNMSGNGYFSQAVGDTSFPLWLFSNFSLNLICKMYNIYAFCIILASKLIGNVFCS